LTEVHPELQAEQAHIDRAYRRLAETRDEAVRLRNMVEVGQGGTQQARWEREVIHDNIAGRLAQLHLGDRSLCFGRIDQSEAAGGGSFHIGRVAVSDADQEPLIVDWRAPVAEAFYRATGRDPQGLVRRRHFACRGQQLLGIEDEFFGEAAGSAAVTVGGRQLTGQGALISALEEARTGRLTDIVGTIQAEQDEIIRARLPGVLVVQGGPGTGKTVVALHRAAYLLYSHRFPLEGQGVLVVGPNRLFLGYIEQVLPSLGEAGVELAVLADLVGGGVRVQGRDESRAARRKGDLAMVHVVRRAVSDRQRPLSRPLRVGMGVRVLRLSVEQSERIVADARRRYRTHNGARRFVSQSLFEALAASHPDAPDPATVREQVAASAEVREALAWMWPTLTPAQLLHDLYGSRALLRSAGGRHLDAADIEALRRPWRPDRDGSRVVWTVDDVPLLDEARELLGFRSGRKHRDDFRTYGHIVVDEAQDLSPMQLRMLTRRSLNGSMTVVGDIAQSTGAWAHANWEEILEHLPDRRPTRRAELTVGYRIPGPSMALAARVLRQAAPDLSPPVSVRTTGTPPRIEPAGPAGLAARVVEVALEERDEIGSGNVAVIVPASFQQQVVEAFDAAGVDFGQAQRDGLDHTVTIVPVGVVKGLEVDAAVVVEPAAIMAEEAQGARALYVALTRATRRLALVHQRPLPGVLADADVPTAVA
jgi:DNA helicase IV